MHQSVTTTALDESFSPLLKTRRTCETPSKKES
jgi:hypothetical protein